MEIGKSQKQNKLRKQYDREYYLNHREKKIKMAKEWAIEHPEKKKEIELNWRKRNMEKIKVKAKNWRENNIEQCKEKAKNFAKEYEKDENNKIKRRAKHQAQYHTELKPACEICGSIERLHRHHWRYDKPQLVNTLCQTCHDIQHVKHWDQSIFAGGNLQ